MSRRKWFLGVAVALLVTASAVTAQAPQGRGGRGGAPDTVMPARQLKPGLFLITGAGANTLVRVTTEGLIVVDTKNPGEEQYNGLITQIKAELVNLPQTSKVVEGITVPEWLPAGSGTDQAAFCATGSHASSAATLWSPSPGNTPLAATGR